VNSGLKNMSVEALGKSGTAIFAGTLFNAWSSDYGGVYCSTNNGASWTEVNDGLAKEGIKSIVTIGDTIFAGTNTKGIYISTNNGALWNQSNTGLTNTCINDLAVSNGNIYAGTNIGAFCSTNNGASWTGDTNFRGQVEAIAAKDDTVFAGTWWDRGIYISTNNGASWTMAGNGLSDINVTALAVHDGAVFAGTENGGIFLSTNNGASWKAVNSGLTDLGINSLAVIGDTVFAGIANSGVWLRPVSEMTSTKPHKQMNNHARKRACVLACTHSGIVANYTVRSRCRVRLELYTICGEKIVFHDRGEQAPGDYRVRLADADLAAGLYVYRFLAGNYRESNLFKMRAVHEPRF
jgi:hypothetical protein